MQSSILNSRLRRAALLGATMISGLVASQAYAQTAPAADDAVEEVVVTGYRGSLVQSTIEKRNAVNFADSIFAEDIGKFPDSNIAESFNRIPGITITRDITGEGATVAIRGLGPNFTNVTLNGAPIAVASSGPTDAQGTDRSVDLSFFPTDLFTQLTVNKSYAANLLEGGASGNINMRAARPFDRSGQHITVSVQGVQQGEADKIGYRGSLIASKTWGNFGVLAGVSGQRFFSDVRGYETIGYTNPNLSAAQCGAATGCNSTGGGNFTIPAVVPAGAGAGLVAGQTIDQAFLLANNPGATIQQIDNGLIPRLGRPSQSAGRRDRLNAIVGLEWRPSDNLHFYIDGLYGKKDNELIRQEMMWIGRNSSLIPTKLTFDRTDCSTGCVVESGTFANAQFFLEFRPYLEQTELWNINPGVEWQISDNLKASFSANSSRSTFHRENPTVGPVTPLGQGITVDYVNNPSGAPSITTNVDLNNPANFVWSGGRVNLNDEYRVNRLEGIRGDLTWGDENLNLRAGAAYDDTSRSIRGTDNTQEWQNAVCGNRPSVFLPGPNSQPPCAGLNQPGAAPAGYPTYPGYGTGYSAGATTPFTYLGSLVPVASLASYLTPGDAGFVTVDWEKFKAATNYDALQAASPESGGPTTGAQGGFIGEKVTSFFTEVNGVRTIGGNDLRFNAGARYVRTEQTIAGRVTASDPRNTPVGGPNLVDGGLFPNVVTIATTQNTYDKVLPAVNISYDVADNAVVRFAASETMTRPDPSAQLPGLNFSAPSADAAGIGNPALAPYFSKNIDLGFELYTGREGVIGVNAFRKALTGFTNTQVVTQPFSFLAAYGVTYASLNATQRTAIDLRGGPTVANIQVSSQVNVPNELVINGLEFQWVQPLDFVTESFGVTGFGLIANATLVNQSTDGPAIAYSVAKSTYNLTGYYEANGVTVRLTHTFREGSQNSGANQNGIPLAALFSDDYSQTDLSSSFDLGELLGMNNGPQLTFDVVNIGDSELRSYFQYPNATFTYYKPGRQFLIGVRTTF